MPTATAAVVESTDAPSTLQSIEVGEPRRDEVLPFDELVEAVAFDRVEDVVGAMKDGSGSSPSS